MKRKTLTTAVMAGLTGMAGMVGVSNAVNLNPDGLGQVLLYPYYTVRGGNDTLISVVNTTDNAKGIKIRFIEGLNSREVLDFNIYMSPFDVWVAGISATDEGGAKLVFDDRTCTAPYFVEHPDHSDGAGRATINFRPFQYVGPNGDGGPSGIDRTASGYIEIIEMGTLTNATKGSANAATHVNGEPNNCLQLENAWVLGAGYWDANPTVDMDPPSGGLFGGAGIVNTVNGTYITYNATAIDGFLSSVNHTNPGSLEPTLGSGSSESIVFINGEIDRQIWPNSIDAVNATIMYNQIMNEYVLGGSANATTEWVVTFPTKRFHVDTAPGGPGSPGGVPPFTSSWTVASPGACEQINFRVWDREERAPGPGGVPISPQPPGPVGFQLCEEANVIRFGPGVPAASEILGAPSAEGGIFGYRNFGLPAGFNSGWVRFDFNPDITNPIHESRDSVAGQTYLGLPVIGFSANVYTNNTLQDDDAGGLVRANYGGTFTHRGTRATTLAPFDGS